jgi:phenylpropionate dioxygenase-like ring-hydroxylating dioxygenase large terminal subunit
MGTEGLAALVRDDRVQARVYTDPAVFNAEIERIFARAWCYVGHESQVPRPGSFIRAAIANRPLLMVRGDDGEIAVLHNRCPHRGALLVGERCGHAARFRCPYHAWTFRTDGRLQSVPLPEGYAGIDLDDAALSMQHPPRVAAYRGFIFASLAADGPDLETFLDGTRAAIDNIVERSPTGQVEVAGGCFRVRMRNNWKIYLENMHDGLHPMIVHQPSIDPARTMMRRPEPLSPLTEFALTVIAANGQTYDTMAGLPVRLFPFGHTEMAAFRANPALDDEFAAYRAELARVRGADRADALMREARLSTMFYPSASVQATSLQMRVIIPEAVDSTLIEVWTLRLVGAPDSLYRRTITLANTVHSPSSVVKHDDVGAYVRVQQGLGGRDAWVDIRRGRNDPSTAVSEAYIRNQYRAWCDYMNAP